MIWKQVSRYPGYEISSTGEFRSLDRDTYRAGKKFRMPGKKFRPGLATMGYFTVRIKAKSHYIHILVLETFVGPRPTKHVANHKDGVKTNNKVENLEWVTISRNTQHAIELGLTPVGQARADSKISDADIKVIKFLVATKKITQTEVAKVYKVSPSYISMIFNQLKRHRDASL